MRGCGGAGKLARALRGGVITIVVNCILGIFRPQPDPLPDGGVLRRIGEVGMVVGAE